MPQTTPKSETNVSSFLTDMLDEMDSEFQTMSSSIQNRMSEMDKRMETLERSITDLMTDAGLENPKESSITNGSISASSRSTQPTSSSKAMAAPQSSVL